MSGGIHLAGLQTRAEMQRSYDLEMDTRLAEETTVLVESYTVLTLSRHLLPFC